VKYWEIIADNLSKAGWSYGYVSAVDSQRRTIWIADAHRDDGKRFVVRANEKLTAFIQLKSATRGDSPAVGCSAWLGVSGRLQKALPVLLGDNGDAGARIT
jgi:hypothetical protein